MHFYILCDIFLSQGGVNFMVNRLKEIRKILEMNQTEFAKRLGLTQTAFSMIESGVRTLSDRHIKIICSEFGISESWFRTGKGDMFLTSPYEKEFIDIFENLTPDSKDYLFVMAKELLKTQNKLLKSKESE